MKPTGFYKLSQAYIELVARLGGVYRDNKERPVYCCLQDRDNPGIYWAIPASDASHRTREQLARIQRLCDLPERDIRSCFYHIGHTNRPAIFKISNVLPVTETHIDGEYISQGVHLMMKSKSQIAAITRKLKRILFDEHLHPDKYEQRITTIYTHISAALRIDVAPAQSGAAESATSPSAGKKPSVVERIRADRERRHENPEHGDVKKRGSKDEPSL